MNQLYFIIPLFAIVIGVAYGNIGFTPIYQPPHSTYPYAQLSDTTTQLCSDIPNDILINSNDSVFGITHSEDTDSHLITIESSGVYHVLASPQIGKILPQANGEHNFWLAINGTDMQNTNIKGSIDALTQPGETFVNVLNWVGYLKKDSTISFRQSCSTGIGTVFTNQSTPDTPSIIISIVRVS